MSLDIKYPHLLKEFIREKNPGIDPANLKSGSNKKVWWRCNKNHEYCAKVCHRTLSGSRCPYCYGKKLSIERSLAHKRPDLCNEFHPTKNLPLDPSQIHASSRIKVWWRCANNPSHEWTSTVDNRNKGNGCPFCSGKKADPSNALASLNPKLAQEWHPQLNQNITPSDVTPHSNLKVWWQCSKKNYHIWQTGVSHRSIGTNCPYCARQKCHPNDSALATLHPDVIKEWSTKLNPSIDLSQLYASSKKIVVWKCAKDELHNPWRATIYIRSIGKGRCPACYFGRSVGPFEESLKYQHPDLSREWHNENNLLPTEVTPGSGIKVKWQCPIKTSHSYFSKICHRVRGHGCPYCNNAPTLPEIRIYSELKHIYPDIQLHHTCNGAKIDIYLPEIKTAIEWDSLYHHQNAFQRDVKKSLKLLSYKMYVIRLRHRNLPILDINQLTPIVVDSDDVSLEIMKQLIHSLITVTKNSEQKNKLIAYLSARSFVNVNLYEELRQYKGRPAPQQSLGELYPEAHKIWHSKLNQPITPNDVYPASHEIFWWQCQICKHEWKRQISSQCSRKVNGTPINILRCPNCTKSKPTPQYNLAKLFPELVNEISTEDNIGFNPKIETPYSGKKIIWKCKKCGYKWAATITSRSDRKAGCPHCNGKILTHALSLAGKCPEAIAAWDYEKNKIKPSEIFANTHTKYFFKCSCGKSFECRPIKFFKRKTTLKCPSCTNSKPNNLAKLFPELVNEISIEDNIGFDPNIESPFSGKKITWKCKTCSHKWKTSILSRSRAKTGCPNCKGKILTLAHSLVGKCPETADAWDYEKNKIKPSEIFANTHTKYFFKCSCGKSFECRPNKFILGQRQCKQCARKK